MGNRIALYLLCGLSVIFFITWQEMKQVGYVRTDKSDSRYKGTIWKRDLPSHAPSDSSVSITKIEIPFAILEYIFSGKKLLKEDKEFKEKYVYGKTCEEVNEMFYGGFRDIFDTSTP